MMPTITAIMLSMLVSEVLCQAVADLASLATTRARNLHRFQDFRIWGSASRSLGYGKGLAFEVKGVGFGSFS